MFDDAKEELKRLEAELLAEEEPEQPEEDPLEEDPLAEESQADFLTDDTPVVYSNYSNQYGKTLRNYASGYRAYNADRTDEDPEKVSRALLEEGENRGVRIWAVIALVLLAAIIGVLFWYLRLLGYLG